MANNPKLLITPGVLYQYNQKAADELKADQDRINAKLAERPPEDFISTASEEPGRVPVTYLFDRGDYRRGNLVGATDTQAGEVVDTPGSPKDVLATAFHLLGIGPATTVPGSQGEPLKIAGTGVFRPELLGLSQSGRS